jgi:hypothetical protein
MAEIARPLSEVYRASGYPTAPVTVTNAPIVARLNSDRAVRGGLSFWIPMSIAITPSTSPARKRTA